MAPTSPGWDDVRRRGDWALHHPRLVMALKSAVAAGLSYAVAVRLPGEISEYAFYAPLGAVVTMYPTAKRSVQQTIKAVLAIAIGAAMAITADRLLGPNLWVIAALVGLGVVVGGLPFLGDMRGYVPIAALFVMVIGQGEEVGYAAAYAGLFLMGALVTLALHALFPTVPLRQTAQALEGLRQALAAHLLYLADQLRSEDPDDRLVREAPGRPALAALAEGARDAVQEAQDAFEHNRRAGRHRDRLTEHAETFRALDRVGLLVDDLYALAQDQPWGADVLRLDAELREPTATALAELAAAVPHIGLTDQEAGRRESVDAAVRDLGVALREHEEAHGQDAQALVVATVATTLRRTLSVLTPGDVRLSTRPIPVVTPDQAPASGDVTRAGPAEAAGSRDA